MCHLVMNICREANQSIMFKINPIWLAKLSPKLTQASGLMNVQENLSLNNIVLQLVSLYASDSLVRPVETPSICK